MTCSSETFDATWERVYQASGRHRNRYPFDSVIQFVYRHRPKDVPAKQVRILEVGCGTGNNLWFAAREGFKVSGIDASKTAIGVAQERFERDGLKGDLRVGDATELPFDDGIFDMAIDRAALSHTPKDTIHQSVGEVRRVLKPGGMFHFNPFGEGCTSTQDGAHNPADVSGTLTDITEGTLAGVGFACVYSRAEVEALFENGWNLFSLRRIENTEMIEPENLVHDEWIALAGKK